MVHVELITLLLSQSSNMFAELSSSFSYIGQLLVSEDSQTEAPLEKLLFLFVLMFYIPVNIFPPNIIPKSIFEVLNRLGNNDDNRYSWKLTCRIRIHCC